MRRFSDEEQREAAGVMRLFEVQQTDPLPLCCEEQPLVAVTEGPEEGPSKSET